MEMLTISANQIEVGDRLGLGRGSIPLGAVSRVEVVPGPDGLDLVDIFTEDKGPNPEMPTVTFAEHVTVTVFR